MKEVSVGGIKFSNDLPFVLIAGPCVIESERHCLYMCERLMEITSKLGIKFIFKSSFDKANRTSKSSYRGVGLDDGLKVFKKVKTTFNCAVVTDVHESCQVERVGEIVDLLQIPAFLCRQTDLLVAAAKTGLPLHVKKAQFLAPWDMKNVCQKIVNNGNENILLCERGTMFGYNNLVVDMRSLAIMREFEFPVIFDATHSVQIPGGNGTSSGGNRDYVQPLASAALSLRVAGLYLETHDDPDNALCDGPNMVPLEHMETFLNYMKEFDCIAKRISTIDMSYAKSSKIKVGL